MTGTAATGKTNLPLRELPMTVHAVPQQVIEEQAVNDLAGALQNVPGVYAFTNYGVYEGYTFRGFLDLFPSLANQLVDGVRHEGNRINSQLTNIERVEVFKGPSSALYGGGAIGATVNLDSEEAAPQPAYDFSASAGSWKPARGTFGATGRLGVSNAVLYRLDVGAETREGYRHNETRRVQVSPSLAWRIGRKRSTERLLHVQSRSLRRRRGHPARQHRTWKVAAGKLVPRRAAGPELPDALRFRRNRTTTTCRSPTPASSATRGASGTRFSYRPVNDDYFLAEFLFVEADELDGVPGISCSSSTTAGR